MENQKTYIIGFGVFIILLVLWMMVKRSDGGGIKKDKCYIQNDTKDMSNYRELKIGSNDNVLYSVQDIKTKQIATYPGKYVLNKESGMLDLTLKYNSITYQEYFMYADDILTLCDPNGVPNADNGKKVTLKSGKCKNIL
jgi:hypothetical protein